MNKNQNKSLFAKPIFVWLAIIAIVVALVSLPEGNGSQLQSFDIKKLASAIKNNEIVKMSVRGDPKAGKDWYFINGEIKNPVFDVNNPSNDVPRTLKFKFEGRVTEDLYKQISDPSSPWEIKEEPASSFWGDLLINILPILLIMGIIYFIFFRQFRGGTKGALDFG